MGILDKLIDFMNLEEKNEEKNEAPALRDNLAEEEVPKIKLSEVTEFIRELESYYTNDIFKERSEFINANLSEEEIIFQKKRIAQDEEALESLSLLKSRVIEQERSCSEIWGKSSYSFYDELETIKLKEIFNETFEIIRQLVEINVKEELDEIIIKRLEKYYKSWKLESSFITPITSLRIKDRKTHEETYEFGRFSKKIIAEDEMVLMKEQISAIKQLKIQISELSNIQAIWIRCVTLTRKQFNFIKKTLVFQNDWEVGEEDKLSYDIVGIDEIEYYIRAVLQLILQRKEYVLISVLIPSYNLLQQLSGIIEINEENGKVEILDKEKYVLMERNGAYRESLKFQIISKKEKINGIYFLAYETFIKNFVE